MQASEVGPRMQAFLDMYNGHAPEAIRLGREYNEPILLCVESVPDTIRPGIKLVGKRVGRLRDELDLDAYTVRYLLHQIQTHDPATDAIFVLQFDKSTVESAVIRIKE